MEIDGSLIYILFAIAYFIFQIFTGRNKKKKQANKPKSRPTQSKTPNADSEEIPSFEELFKTLTQSSETKKTQTNQPKSNVKSVEDIEKAKEAKKNESHRIRPRIPQNDHSLELVDLEETEEEEIPIESSFNVEEIDWPKAIITKEILDRKYV